MANGKFININFPFKDSDKGFLLELNSDDKRAIKADLMHLILTRKGERLYLPDFGANLRQYLFEPNDDEARARIKVEIQESITKYIPNLQVDEITLTGGEPGKIRNEQHVLVGIDYTVTIGAFKRSDSIEIEL